MDWKRLQLKKGTSNIDAKISDAIDEIMEDILGNEDKVVSFVPDKNTNISSVQFIMKTDEIKILEIDVIKKEAGKSSFWEKLLNLFKKRK